MRSRVVCSSYIFVVLVGAECSEDGAVILWDTVNMMPIQILHFRKPVVRLALWILAEVLC